MEKETHEAKIEIELGCYDPEDSRYLSSTTVEDDFLEKYNLKPGDWVKYKIDNETNDIIILGKIETTKKILPVEKTI